MNPEPCPTLSEVYVSRHCSEEVLLNDLEKLKRLNPTEEKQSFAGNKVLHHYQLENLCQVKLKNGSFADLMNDPGKRQIFWERACKYARGSRANNLPLRAFEMWRRLNGCLVQMFKPSTAKMVYKTFNATSVLDPTAGWGGRMLGAWAAGIPYIGFDTNHSLAPAYSGMMNILPSDAQVEIRFEDCLKADFSQLAYDCVLTSPPYDNLEMYPGMTPFESKKTFFLTFLIPLLDKCRRHCKKDGWVCFNIPPAMYLTLTTTYKYEKCHRELSIVQQKVAGKTNQEKIYCWRV